MPLGPQPELALIAEGDLANRALHVRTRGTTGASA